MTPVPLKPIAPRASVLDSLILITSVVATVISLIFAAKLNTVNNAALTC